MPLKLYEPTRQASYDTAYNTYDVGWRDLGARYKAQNILEVCDGRRFASALECGAGDGSVLRYLAKANFAPRLYASEISASGTAVIQQRLESQLAGVIRFDGYHLPLADDACDIVVLTHVLEHVEHPRWLLRELRRVAPLLAIEVPLDYRPGIDRRTEALLAYGHISLFSPTTIRFLLRSEGLEAVAEKCSIINRELIEYQYRMQHKRPMPLLQQALITLRRRLGSVRRHLLPKVWREELTYSAYTVLCRRSPS